MCHTHTFIIYSAYNVPFGVSLINLSMKTDLDIFLYECTSIIFIDKNRMKIHEHHVSDGI